MTGLVRGFILHNQCTNSKLSMLTTNFLSLVLVERAPLEHEVGLSPPQWAFTAFQKSGGVAQTIGK